MYVYIIDLGINVWGIPKKVEIKYLTELYKRIIDHVLAGKTCRNHVQSMSA